MMEIADVVLLMSLVIAASAVVMIAIQAPLQRRELRLIAEKTRLDVITAIDEIATLAMRVDDADRHLRRLVQRIDQLQLAGGGSSAGYERAASLARDGATTEQLVEQCGLTRGEAQLLRRLSQTAA